MMMILLLAITTTIYLVAIAFEDLRERQIYTFPCTLLTIAWISQGLNTGLYQWQQLTWYMVVVLVLFSILKKSKIWGDGDSDLFLMYAAVNVAFGEGLTSTFFVTEISLFAAALVLSVLIAIAEARIKKEKLCKSSSVAVAPGLVVVIIAIIWRGVISCLMM